jgi:hypothetical protein
MQNLPAGVDLCCCAEGARKICRNKIILGDDFAIFFYKKKNSFAVCCCPTSSSGSSNGFTCLQVLLAFTIAFLS